jgi:HK97 family phage portal protein
MRRKGTQPSGVSLIQALNAQRTIDNINRQINDQVTPYSDNKLSYVEKCYLLNDLFYTVIKLIVDKAIISPWAVYRIVDDKAFKLMKAQQKQLGQPGAYTKMMAYAYKALEPYDRDERLNAVLAQPNPNSFLSKHHANLWTSKLITGDYYERWETTDGGLNGGKLAALDELPAQYMQIRNNRAIPVRVTGYDLLAGVNVKFEPEEILHECYPNPEWSVDGVQLYGMSPARALLRRIQRNNSSQTTGINTFKNGGVNGVAYLDLPDEVMKLDPLGTFTMDQANAIKAKWNEVVKGGVNNAGSTVFSGYKVGFTEIGLSPHDLDQAVIELSDLRIIAAAYGVPSQLLNDPDGKQYANQSEGEKALTIRCALPLLNDREQSFNAKLRQLSAYKNTDIWVSYDMSVYSELEENKKEQVDWLEKAWWLTPNQKLQIMGETVSDDPLMNKVIIPSGSVLLEDIAAEPEGSTQQDQDDLEKEGINDYK